MWRGDLPKAGVEGNVPGVMGWRGDLPKAGVEGKCPRSGGVEGKVPLVVTFIITDSMQIDFEVIRCPVNQELLVIN